MNYTVAEKLAAAERGELWWDVEGSGWTKLSDDVLGPYTEADVTATWATYHIGAKPPQPADLKALLDEARGHIDSLCDYVAEGGVIGRLVGAGDAYRDAQEFIKKLEAA